MSGTSMDGVDAAVVELVRGTDGLRLRTLAALTRRYPRPLAARLTHASGAGAASAFEHAKLSHDVGRVFARAAHAVVARAGLDFAAIDAVASHGQTIAHYPGRPTITVQIGEASVIAERTGVTTVSDFRAADAAAGGEGAPLAPLVHHRLFSHPRLSRAVQNLGGMGNVTLLAPGGGVEAIEGSDTGPGNVLIDECVSLLTGGRRRMDAGGRLARGGAVDERVIREVLAAPFFRRRLPASTGREDFGRELARKLVSGARRRRLDPKSIVASVTMATARSVARACEKLAEHPVDELYVCGGGALNGTLMDMIAACMPNARVHSTAVLGIDPAYVEAQAFCVLGYLALAGEPGNVPAVTGAEGRRVLGKITPGGNYRASVLR